MPKKKKPIVRILVAVDYENLVFNSSLPETYSIEAGFDRIIKTITEEVGEIVGVFAFLPSDRALVWGENLHNLGFNVVLCPRVKDKKGENKDTTDERLIELTLWLINNLNELTHLCIASGDKDFGPLMKKAALKGLKRMIVAGNLQSLANKLIELADENPATGKKMVYVFSPTE